METGKDKKTGLECVKLVYEFTKMIKRTLRIPLSLKGNKEEVEILVSQFYNKHGKHSFNSFRHSREQKRPHSGPFNPILI